MKRTFLVFQIVLLACSACGSGETATVKVAPPVSKMLTSRSVHTATTLPSGEVLIAGGMSDGGGSLESVELFDPGKNRFEALTPLASRRSSHTATRLPDGRVVIAGGYDGASYLDSIEIFDPATRRFSSGGSLHEGRSGHTATLLGDGTILFAGGVGSGWSFLRSAERYDPAKRESRPAGSMSVPRESHTAALLRDGRVLLIGGHSGRRERMVVYASSELFSPAANSFEPAAEMITPRHKHDSITLKDGRVLVLGGADRTDRNFFDSTEIYDPKQNVFAEGPQMAHRRYKIAGTSVLLDSGDVVVPAGARRGEILEVGTGQFREIPVTFPDAYRFAAAVLLPGGDVLVSGGYGEGIRSTPAVWRLSVP